MLKQVPSTKAAWAFLAALPFALATSALANDRDGRDGRDNNDRGRANECSERQSQRSSLYVVGLTSDMRLVCFSERNPSRETSIGLISGLSGDTALIGIDYRVQDGLLYGVGNAGGIYTINVNNAAATKVSQLSIALNGTSFGVDFNPAADRLRIISDTGQNLRHNVNAGGVTLVDGTLSYAPPTPATGVTAAAYTNNDLDPSTATTLYDIDTNLDQVAIQSPANSGSLAATGKLTVDATSIAGFDIYSTIRNGVTVNVQGLAALRTADGATRLYSINLATGKATSRGAFDGNVQVIDIAIPLNQL